MTKIEYDHQKFYIDGELDTKQEFADVEELLYNIGAATYYKMVECSNISYKTYMNLMNSTAWRLSGKESHEAYQEELAQRAEEYEMWENHENENKYALKSVMQKHDPKKLREFLDSRRAYWTAKQTESKENPVARLTAVHQTNATTYAKSVLRTIEKNK